MTKISDITSGALKTAENAELGKRLKRRKPALILDMQALQENLVDWRAPRVSTRAMRLS